MPAILRGPPERHKRMQRRACRHLQHLRGKLLSLRYGYEPIDAYMLCNVCADLRISSIVDVPNWVVSFYFPRVVLE
ncbi:acetamidase/formamidase family protein [Variovorax gracilis]|uniref:acetamidase/formamidase family protein n=1 Tax=Variovorax gracilis TaxID=3053502 RepID=UPI00336BC5BB